MKDWVYQKNLAKQKKLVSTEVPAEQIVILSPSQREKLAKQLNGWETFIIDLEQKKGEEPPINVLYKNDFTWSHSIKSTSIEKIPKLRFKRCYCLAPYSKASNAIFYLINARLKACADQRYEFSDVTLDHEYQDISRLWQALLELTDKIT